MGTLSDGHGPLLVHSSKLLPLIVALEILYTWDGDYFNFNYALVWPRYYTGMVPEALAHCNWCGLGFIPVWSQKLLQLQLHPGEEAPVRHREVPVTLRTWGTLHW